MPGACEWTARCHIGAIGSLHRAAHRCPAEASVPLDIPLRLSTATSCLSPPAGPALAPGDDLIGLSHAVRPLSTDRRIS